MLAHMHRFLRFFSALPTFAVAAIVISRFASAESSLDDILHKNPWYFVTAVSSFLVSLFHVGLFLVSFIVDVGGWWYWRFPGFVINDNYVNFWTYDYAWAFFWFLQLTVELLVPPSLRAYDIEITAIVTALYAAQAASCVPVVYAAYSDWKINN